MTTVVLFLGESQVTSQFYFTELLANKNPILGSFVKLPDKVHFQEIIFKKELHIFLDD